MPETVLRFLPGRKKRFKKKTLYKLQESTSKIYILNVDLGFWKCAMLMKNGKKEITEGIELPNQEKGKRKNYKYLGILEANAIKQMEIK